MKIKSLFQRTKTALDFLLTGFYGQVLIVSAKMVSFLIFLFLRHVMAYRRSLIKENLSTSFPEKSKSEIKKLTTEYYSHMSDLIIEPFLFHLAPLSTRNSLANYTNPEMLDRLYGEQKQVVLFASHYGNWEYLINLPEATRYNVHTAYSPISNVLMNKTMIRLRSFFGMKLIPKNNFYRQALSLMNERINLNLLIVIADQRPAPGNDKFHISFMNRQTAVQTGGERIAFVSKATVVYVECRKDARFKYNFTFAMMNSDPVKPLELTRAYYQILEKSLSHAPSYWLWSHNRWKALLSTNTCAV